jgi:hypothetical protein
MKWHRIETLPLRVVESRASQLDRSGLEGA